MPLTIDTRFAIDRNHNRRIEPEEITGLDGLGEKDADDDQALSEREFEDVWFEYAKDHWVPADREFREVKDGFVTVVRMNRVELDTGQVDVSVSFRPA